MRRPLGLGIALTVALLAAPATAAASTLVNAGGTLSFTSAADAVNHVTLTGAGTVIVELVAGDADPIGSVSGCTAVTPQQYSCSGVAQAVVDAAGGDDAISAVGLGVPIQIHGGGGSDVLSGGDVNDTLDGGDGDDWLSPNLGTDVVSGGTGLDRVAYGARPELSLTLDGQPNDGAAGEGDNVLADVEDATVTVAAATTVTLVGSAAANSLDVDGGRALITGGPGADQLSGDVLDDIIDARDGYPDRVYCGPGNDTALVDPLDTVSATCENAPVVAVPGLEDRPPTVEWTAPAARASFRGDAPATLAVNAADDRGIAGVRFFDDDRLLCDDTVAPFACPYQPRGADVGSNTLIAIASDGAGQTASAIRVVTVTRFRPGLSLSLQPKRDRAAPYRVRARGKLSSAPCRGAVIVTFKAGSRTLARRRAKLSGSCRYGVTLRLSVRPALRVRVRARYPGSPTTLARSSPSRSARLG